MTLARPMGCRLVAIACLAAAGLLMEGKRAPGDEAPATALATRLRQPVALAFSTDGTRLLVANRRSGTISEIDPRSAAVVAEHEVGRGLADLAPLPDGHRWIAIDQAADRVLLLDHRADKLEIVAELGVSLDPVRVALVHDGTSCVVASRWTRRLTVLEIASDSAALKAVGTIDLPFSPLAMIATQDGASVFVADAFGGRVAVVDPRRLAVKVVHELPGHNIRGLALSADGRTLALSHQVLSRLARTSFDDIHWGGLIRNELRLLSVEALIATDPQTDVLRGSRTFDLGEVTDAAGDPAGVVLRPDGRAIVAYAGVDELAVGVGRGAPRRVRVGRRPLAVVVDRTGENAYVADSLDDTVSVVAIATGRRVKSIALGPRPPLGAAARGERLFYDARQSHDGWLSCHSCHTDGHTSGQLSDTLGDDSYGAPKLVPSLLGVAETAPWAWNGSKERLEKQVQQSIELTMHGAVRTEGQVGDLVAYLSSLGAPPREAAGADSSDATARGRALFGAKGCIHCHAPPFFTSANRYDVGLPDELGQRRFNPPALQGVSRRDRFLHDGRSHSLEDVFRVHGHPRGTNFSPPEIEQLVAYLRSL